MSTFIHMLKLRTDAAQNRADILLAADKVFAEHGVAAPLDLVCKEANVGRATLYRNFPDRHALLFDLLEIAIDKMEEKATELGDAPDALYELLRFQAQTCNARTSLMDYWRVVDPMIADVIHARDRIRGFTMPLLKRAIDAGLCRTGLTAEDVPLLITMLGAALRGRSDEERTKLGGRALELLLEGLRPRVPLS